MRLSQALIGTGLIGSSLSTYFVFEETDNYFYAGASCFAGLITSAIGLGWYIHQQRQRNNNIDLEIIDRIEDEEMELARVNREAITVAPPNTPVYLEHERAETTFNPSHSMIAQDGSQDLSQQNEIMTAINIELLEQNRRMSRDLRCVKNKVTNLEGVVNNLQLRPAVVQPSAPPPAPINRHRRRNTELWPTVTEVLRVDPAVQPMADNISRVSSPPSYGEVTRQLNEISANFSNRIPLTVLEGDSEEPLQSFRPISGLSRQY